MDWNNYQPQHFNLRRHVALYMSAWIEIRPNGVCTSRQKCRTLYECVDWNNSHRKKFIYFLGRTLYECVDWNTLNKGKRKSIWVALYMSAWIEISLPCPLTVWVTVALYMSAWIEIRWTPKRGDCLEVALYMSAWIEIMCTSERRSRFASHSIWVRGLKLFFDTFGNFIL